MKSSFGIWRYPQKLVQVLFLQRLFWKRKRVKLESIKDTDLTSDGRCNPRYALSRVFIRTYPQPWWVEQCDLISAVGKSNPKCVCIQGPSTTTGPQGPLFFLQHLSIYLIKTQVQLDLFGNIDINFLKKICLETWIAV